MKAIVLSLKDLVIEISYFFIWLLQWIIRLRECSFREIDRNKGEKVVVVCNGPSARTFPFDKYREQGYSFCCVNYFALDEALFYTLKPKYYCLIDPAFACQAYQETENCRKLIQILESVDWEMNIVTRKGTEFPLNNTKIRWRYFNVNYYLGKFNGFKAVLFKYNIACCGFQNVSIAAIYYFVMSGVQKIVLCGVENDWHRELIVDENNNVYREMTHFYGNERICVTGSEIEKGELYRYFEWYALTLKEHNVLSKFAKWQNVCIENTCLNSYIDSYDKVQC